MAATNSDLEIKSKKEKKIYIFNYEKLIYSACTEFDPEASPYTCLGTPWEKRARHKHLMQLIWKKMQEKGCFWGVFSHNSYDRNGNFFDPKSQADRERAKSEADYIANAVHIRDTLSRSYGVDFSRVPMSTFNIVTATDEECRNWGNDNYNGYIDSLVVGHNQKCSDKPIDLNSPEDKSRVVVVGDTDSKWGTLVKNAGYSLAPHIETVSFLVVWHDIEFLIEDLGITHEEVSVARLAILADSKSFEEGDDAVNTQEAELNCIDDIISKMMKQSPKTLETPEYVDDEWVLIPSEEIQSEEGNLSAGAGVAAVAGVAGPGPDVAASGNTDTPGAAYLPGWLSSLGSVFSSNNASTHANNRVSPDARKINS